MQAAKPSVDAAVDKPKKNVHIDVDPEFHRRLRMMCAYKEVRLKDYAIGALEHQLAADEESIATSRAKKP